MAAEHSETTLRRGVSILFALSADEARDNGGLGVTRIAELVGREKTQVSRTLKTLEKCGLVSRNVKSLQYALSWQLFALAARAGDRRLLELTPPILERLVARLQETAYLNVLRGNEVLTVASQVGSRVVQASAAMGQVTPAYASSAGRALLLDHQPQQMRAMFEAVTFQPHGPNTPKDAQDLITRVQEARPGGVAVADEEYEPGLLGIAAPVRDAQGRIVAALNVSGPKFRLGQRLDEACSAVRSAAAELSAHLGAPGETCGGNRCD